MNHKLRSCSVAILGTLLAGAPTGLAVAAKPAPAASRPLNVHPRPIATDKSVKYDFDIVYVRGTRKGDKKFARWPEVFNPLGMEPGADLMLLHPDGSEELLVSGKSGSVTDPFVSFDGQWVYFAQFHNPQPKPANFDGNDYAGSDIYKIHVKTRKIVRLTHQEFTPNLGALAVKKRELLNRYNYPVFNLGPCPAPGGKIVFTSNRNGFQPPRSYTRTTLQLFLMDEDGGNVEEVGYLNLGSALHPTILRDGRIMFSSYETQGVRDIRNWGLWTIHPDGTDWGPLVGAFSSERAFHFQTQLSDGQIIVEEYYNGNNQGWGTYFAFPDRPPSQGFPAFVDATRGVNTPANGGAAFMPVGLVHFTAFSNPFDGPAKLSDPKDPKSPRVGKVTHPSGAPDNHLLTAWTGPLPGPSKEYNTAYSVPDSGIYLIKDGLPIEEPGQMLLIKNDPKYNEQWPRALVPYKRIYGIEEPPRLPFVNDGKRSKQLPEGTPFGLIGTSSLYKRESYPGGRVEDGSVTAAYTGRKDAPYQSLGSLCDAHGHVNWSYQGSEAGRYNNEDIHAIRIIAFEPKTDGRLMGYVNNRDRKFWNMANERMRILGEFPVRKFSRDGKGSEPIDADGNADTSFLAKIPADVPFTFQMIDKDGMVLTMAQTWHQVRPGEVKNNCGGCHSHSQKPTEFRHTAAAKADYAVWDLSARTPLLTTKWADQSGRKWDVADTSGVRYAKGPVNVEYYRDIKPIFDRSCAACHSRMADKPAGNLVLDDNRPMDARDGGGIQGSFEGSIGHKMPGTFFRVAYDQYFRFGPKMPFRHYCVPQMSRYVRMFQSRRSLLIWKIFGRRLDGWKNDDFALVKVPGDPSTLQYKGKPFHGDLRQVGLAYSGSVMPPPEAVRSGKVKPLTDEDRRTLVRWIDLGCPIDFDYDPFKPDKRGRGWMMDESRPTLTLTYPQAGVNPPLTRLLVGMHDYYTGLDMEGFRVVADFPLDGVAAGKDLAKKFRPLADGVWELKLGRAITDLPRGKITVAVPDKEGNLSRIERTFSVAKDR